MNASHTVLLASLLCVSGLAAHAQTARALVDTAVPREATDAHRATTGSPRGSAADMRGLLETFEAYPVGVPIAGQNFPPANSFGPPGFVWPNTFVRGAGILNNLDVVDLSGAPIGGNNTRALRLRTLIEQNPTGFFIGFNLTWREQFGFYQFRPTLDENSRIGADHYLSTIDELYTFEITDVVAGFVNSRLLWGGTCTDETPGDCAAIGLPTGTITTFHSLVLDPNSFLIATFQESRFCIDFMGNAIPGCTAPAGFQIGDPVPVTAGAWFTLATEFTADANSITSIDLHDGSGETIIARTPVLSSNLFNRVGWNTSYEAESATLLIDNVAANAAFYTAPIPPALECPSYLDNMEWLNTGALLGQNMRWFAALSSGVTVLDIGAPQGQTLQQTNTLANNLYQLSARSELPATYANASSPWSLCIDASTGAGETVRALAIHSPNTGIADGLVTRVFLGARDPVTNDFDDSIFVQINPDFDPFNDTPILGVDIVSTGAQWAANDQFRELCVTVSFNNSLTLAVDGVTIYTGAAFNTSASTFQFETANDADGAGARLRLDNLALECATLCPGDTNGDGVVNFFDLNIVLSGFGSPCD